ncbi:MAG: APC family permease [Acidobacteriia bacterium]|nr:APC family permease [Terriglobia bacterium]
MSKSAGTTEGTEFIKALGLRDVAAMTLVGVVSLRWISRAARMGAPSVTLWFFAWISFFLPLAAAVCELSSRYPEQGGLYAWARRAFGPAHGFVCGWCLWVNNLFWYPSLLLFAAANALLVFGGSLSWLADSRLYSVAFVIVMLWFSVGLNILGLSRSKWLQNIGSIGIWLPAGLLIIFGAIAFTWFGSATSFAPRELLPRHDILTTISLWSAICFAFSGLELTSLVGQEVKNPKRNLPRGVMIAGLAATLIYVAGSVSVLVAVPSKALLERSGIADAIELASGRIGLGGFGPLTGALLALGAVAMNNSWFAGAARVPFAAGVDRALPAVFARIHPRYRTPHVVLVFQGLAASLIFLVSLFFTVGGARTSIQEAYDIMVNLTILIYFLPYLYLFISLVRLRARDSRENNAAQYRVPGGRVGLWFVAGAGGIATAVSLGLVFVPPPGTGNVLNYETNLIGQALIILAIGFILYRRKSSIPAAQGRIP